MEGSRRNISKKTLKIWIILWCVFFFHSHHPSSPPPESLMRSKSQSSSSSVWPAVASTPHGFRNFPRGLSKVAKSWIITPHRNHLLCWGFSSFSCWFFDIFKHKLETRLIKNSNRLRRTHSFIDNNKRVINSLPDVFFFSCLIQK